MRQAREEATRINVFFRHKSLVVEMAGQMVGLISGVFGARSDRRNRMKATNEVINDMINMKTARRKPVTTTGTHL